jgi:hypothetical protein
MAMNEQPSHRFLLFKLSVMENIALTELTLNEMTAINGGQALIYYLGYAVGAVAGTAVSFISGLIGGLEGQHI